MLHLLCALAAAVSGCAMDVGRQEVSEQVQAISGSVLFKNGNCGTQEGRIRNMVAFASVWASHPDMKRCLVNGIFTHNGDGTFAERVFAQMSAPVVTEIQCFPSLANSAGSSVIALAGIQAVGVEFISFANDRLAMETDDILLRTILHEVAHNRGYTHPVAPGVLDTSMSVPEQVAACGLSLHQGFAASPPVRSRALLVEETTLGPVGGGGGYPYTRRCVAGETAAGLTTRTGALVDGLGLACRSDPNRVPTLVGNLVGGSGGFLRDTNCPFGQVLIGVHGNAQDDVLSRIGPICAPIADVTAGNTAASTNQFPNPTHWVGPAFGQGSGYFFERVCPRFMSVRGIQGRAGGSVDRLELFCQRQAAPAGVTETWLNSAGGSGGSFYTERCAGRASLTGLTFEKDWVLARLGGRCNQITKACNGTRCREVLVGTAHVLPSHGGIVADQTREGEQTCPAGQGLVGMNFRFGSLVDSVGGVCANVEAWTDNAQPNAPLSFLPLFGGSGGSPAEIRLCPRGALLTGWDLNAGALVDGVRPVCRWF